jgi:hypothetical protein
MLSSLPSAQLQPALQFKIINLWCWQRFVKRNVKKVNCIERLATEVYIKLKWAYNRGPFDRILLTTSYLRKGQQNSLKLFARSRSVGRPPTNTYLIENSTFWGLQNRGCILMTAVGTTSSCRPSLAITQQRREWTSEYSLFHNQSYPLPWHKKFWHRFTVILPIHYWVLLL